MRLPKEFILIPLIFLLVACASTFYNLQRVERGMTPGEVEAIMGKNHSAKTLDKEGSVYTLYRYEGHLCNPNLSLWDTCDFLVIFRSGRVIETGVKKGKSYSPHMPSLSLFQQP
jgi:hypothetical protein